MGKINYWVLPKGSDTNLIGLLQSRCFNLYVSCKLFSQTPFVEMPPLNRNNIVTCEKCGTQITKLKTARHKKRCSVGLLCSFKRPNFSRKSQKVLNFHKTKKHSAPKLDVTFKCKLCFQKLSGFYALLRYNNT